MSSSTFCTMSPRSGEYRKRVSVGGSLSRLALATCLGGAREMTDTGGVTRVPGTVPSREPEAVFARWR